MDKTKEVMQMIVDEMYEEFTNNPIHKMNVDEVGRIADILKDLSMKVYYCTVVEGIEKSGRYVVEVKEPMMEDAEHELDVLNEKMTHPMSDLDKVNLRNRLQSMLRNL